MRNVLIVGHACCPFMGSEPGVTWNWATHLSAIHKVTVLTHPQFREQVEDYLQRNPNPNLCIRYVSLPRAIDPWVPTRSESGIGLHYLLWQYQALRDAKRLHAERKFDVVHHVSWTTVSAVPVLWKLPIPFIWGPVGGAITAPIKFGQYFAKAWPKELVRTMRIRSLPFFPGLRRAVKHTAVMFGTNNETLDFLRRAGGRDVRYLLDVGLTARESHCLPAAPRDSRVLRLLWAGRLEPRKALPLALDALAAVGDDVQMHLTVAGDGPLRGEWEAKVASLGLQDRVSFLGKVPATDMPGLFAQSDAFLFTSLRDGFGSVVLEAMAHGLPVVTLNHQGVGAALPEGSAIKIAVTNPQDTMARLATSLRRLASKKERDILSAAGRSFAMAQNWPERARIMSNCYEECIKGTL
jgi:glycosyltransferase involved in cell wall biosynthesis